MGPEESLMQKGLRQKQQEASSTRHFSSKPRPSSHSAERASSKSPLFSPNLLQAPGHRRALFLHISHPQSKSFIIPEWVLQQASNTKLTVPFLQGIMHFVMETRGRNHNFRPQALQLTTHVRNGKGPEQSSPCSHCVTPQS